MANATVAPTASRLAASRRISSINIAAPGDTGLPRAAHAPDTASLDGKPLGEEVERARHEAGF